MDIDPPSSSAPSVDEIAAWHARNAHASGRSHDPERKAWALALLFPNDDPKWAAEYTAGWMHDGHLVIPSTCAIYGCAYLRWRCGDLMPALLKLPYCKGPLKGVRNAVADLQTAAIALGAWTTDPDELATFPDAGDVEQIGGFNGANDVHEVCVFGTDTDGGAIESMDGGQTDGSFTEPRKRLMVATERSGTWLVKPEAPYLPSGLPNGRRITGRVKSVRVAAWLDAHLARRLSPRRRVSPRLSSIPMVDCEAVNRPRRAFREVGAGVLAPLPPRSVLGPVPAQRGVVGEESQRNPQARIAAWSFASVPQAS